MKKKLIIFDIDGTLTLSADDDARCFAEAMCEVLQLTEIDTDWSSYRHATDIGILNEIVSREFNRLPSVNEIQEIENILLRKLSKTPPIQPVNGANELLKQIEFRDGYNASIATGSWRKSAIYKLESAGISYRALPLASCDDAVSREEIMQYSQKLAQEKHGEFDSVTYIGDGIWDARACANLNIKMIGRGKGQQAQRLSEYGVENVFEDFSDLNALFALL